MRSNIFATARAAAGAAVLAALAFASAAQAADAEAGKTKADACLGCHGVPSYTNVYPTYHVPRLAGQYAEYIGAALRAYRDGLRRHSTMKAQAHTLADADIDNVAAYFAALDAPAPLAEPPEPPPAIADHVALCAGCHGPDGNSIAPIFPKIAGQARDYLYQSLAAYKSGERQNELMLGIVQTLNDDDMRMLSAYYAQLSGLGILDAGRRVATP